MTAKEHCTASRKPNRRAHAPTRSWRADRPDSRYTRVPCLLLNFTCGKCVQLEITVIVHPESLGAGERRALCWQTIPSPLQKQKVPSASQSSEVKRDGGALGPLGPPSPRPPSHVRVHVPCCIACPCSMVHRMSVFHGAPHGHGHTCDVAHTGLRRGARRPQKGRTKASEGAHEGHLAHKPRRRERRRERHCGHAARAVDHG